MADVVQIQDKKTKLYSMVDRETGKVLKKKTTLGPYKRLPIVTKLEIKKENKLLSLIKKIFTKPRSK